MKKVLLFSISICVLQIAAHSQISEDPDSIRNPDPLDQGGGDCGSAVIIPSLPFSDFGGTSAEVNDHNVFCEYGPVTGGRDVAYHYTPSVDQVVRISLCNSSFDTKLAVYDATNVVPGAELYCNDDSENNPENCRCSPSQQFRSQICCAQLIGGVTYCIVVDGHTNADFGLYTIDINEEEPSNCEPEPTMYTIPDVYENREALMNTSVTLFCFTTPEDLLADDFDRYTQDRKMPPNFILFLDGGEPIPSGEEYGAAVTVQGILTVDPGNPNLTNNLRLTPISFNVLVTGFPTIGANWRPAVCPPGPPCDSCKFAVLISGGWQGESATDRGSTGGDNRADFWDDLVDFYCYKRSHGYCDGNVKVFYYKGAQPDGHPRAADIPVSALDSCTQSKIQAHLNSIALQVAACKALNRETTMEVMVTNHGDTMATANEGGISMVHSAVGGDTVLTAREFRMMLQPLVNAGLTTLDAEFGECHGGQMVQELRDSLDTNECNVTAASAVSGAFTSWSHTGDGGYNYWLNPKVCALQAGKSIDEAIQFANRSFDSTLALLAIATGIRIQQFRDIWQDPGAPFGVQLSAFREMMGARQDSITIRNTIGSGQYFRAIRFNRPCEGDTIQVSPGGRIEFTFTGPTKSCGNVDIQCQDTSGAWIYVSGWNWNVPGSANYHFGQFSRTLDSPAEATGLYVIHSHSDSFKVRVRSINPPLPPTLDTSPSNPEDFAGFAMGWRSESSDEFGDIEANLHTLPDAGDLGFSLSTTPKVLGIGGVESLVVNFDVIEQNVWWENMQLWIKYLGTSPNALISYTLPTADSSAGSVNVNGPGEYAFNLGAIHGEGEHTLTISTTGTVELDCWAVWTAYSTGVPIAVDDLVIYRVGDDIVLTWGEVPAGVSYKVFAADSTSGPWTEIGQVAALTYTHIGQAISGADMKFYHVVAVGP